MQATNLVKSDFVAEFWARSRRLDELEAQARPLLGVANNTAGALSLTPASAVQESTLREEARTHAWENERLRSQLASLEARVSAAEERAHRAAQVATAEVERAHEATRAEAQRCADAESRFQTAQTALAARTKEAAQSTLQAQQAATDAAAAAATHARQLAAARRAAEDTEASAAAATRAAEAALQVEKHKAASSAAAEADARAAAQRATARCETLQQALAEAQREAAQASRAAAAQESLAAEVPSLRAAVQDLQAQVASLRSEAASRSKELAAARQAAVSTAQVAVLQERVRDAEAKAKRAEATAAELAAARSSSPQAKQQTQSADATASAAEMASLRQQLAAAVAAKGAAAAEVARLTTALAYCETQLSNAQLSLAAAEAETASARSSLLRSENHVQLLQEERDALQRFLKAYDDDDEATRGTWAAPGTPAAAAAAGVDALARQRAVRDAREAELGAALNRAHGRLAELEKECNRQQAAADAATKQAGVAAKKAAGAEKEAASLAREVAALQQRLGAGEFDATKLRVLHMKANPEQAARTEAMRAQIERLQRDNGDLQARVDALMAGAATQTAGHAHPPGGGGGGPDPAAVAVAECTVLRRRVADLEKREARYKAVFAESIATVRDAVRCIFGYTLELELPGDKVTVRSSLSGDECHVLCFKVARGDASHGVDPSAELQPGAWSSRPDMKRSVETFVTRCRSIPALTANLTLELFNATTMA